MKENLNTESFQRWLRLMMEAAGLLVAVGIIVSTIRTNCTRLNGVEGSTLRNAQQIQALERSIIRMETDVAYIKEGVREIRAEIKRPP